MCQFKGHLIIVCCHAVYLPSLEPSTDNEIVSHNNPLKEANWQLESFQQSNASGKLGEHFTFIQHIQVGKELLKLGVNSHVDTVLMFSGGATKDTKMEESRSYLNALKDLEGQEGTLAIPQENVLLETNATDSFQNLLFSILRYWSEKGSWPANITVITHAFKARRFLELHAPAIKWPTDRIRVIGIDPSFSASELRETQEHERARGYEPWTTDPYGIGQTLSVKRTQRKWSDSTSGELCSIPGLPVEVKSLLKYEGMTLFSEQLPWETISQRETASTG